MNVWMCSRQRPIVRTRLLTSDWLLRSYPCATRTFELEFGLIPDTSKNTNPNDTEAIVAGRSGTARAVCKQKYKRLTMDADNSRKRSS
jgi:hypothetical protein